MISETFSPSREVRVLWIISTLSWSCFFSTFILPRLYAYNTSNKFNHKVLGATWSIAHIADFAKSKKICPLRGHIFIVLRIFKKTMSNTVCRNLGRIEKKMILHKSSLGLKSFWMSLTPWVRFFTVVMEFQKMRNKEI